MKRTKKINLSLMRKAATATVLLSSSFLMSGCDSGQSVAFYRTIEECQQDNPRSTVACEDAYANALLEAERSAPRYARLQDCEFDFGQGNCITTSSGSQFMPEMSGFFLAELADDYYDYDDPEPLYRYRGHWVNGSGKKYGSKLSKSMKVDSDTFKTKSTSTSTSRTLSRGGFGSMVASKSYSSSSGRSSFGG